MVRLISAIAFIAAAGFLSCSLETVSPEQQYYNKFYKVLQNDWELHFVDTADAFLEVRDIREYHREFGGGEHCNLFVCYPDYVQDYHGYMVSAILAFQDGQNNTTRYGGFQCDSNKEFWIDIDSPLRLIPPPHQFQVGRISSCYYKDSPNSRIKLRLDPLYNTISGTYYSRQLNNGQYTWKSHHFTGAAAN